MAIPGIYELMDNTNIQVLSIKVSVQSDYTFDYYRFVEVSNEVHNELSILAWLLSRLMLGSFMLWLIESLTCGINGNQ